LNQMSNRWENSQFPIRLVPLNQMDNRWKSSQRAFQPLPMNPMKNHTEIAMLRRDASIWTALTLAAIMALAVSGCRKAVSENKEEGDALPKEPVPVRAVKAERTSLKPSIDLVGSLVAIPERSTAVSPQVAGWIKKIMVVEGDRVQAGDEVMQLDARMA